MSSLRGNESDTRSTVVLLVFIAEVRYHRHTTQFAFKPCVLEFVREFQLLVGGPSLATSRYYRHISAAYNSRNSDRREASHRNVPRGQLWRAFCPARRAGRYCLQVHCSPVVVAFLKQPLLRTSLRTADRQSRWPAAECLGLDLLERR